MADTDPSERSGATALGRTTLGVVFTTILIDFIGFSVLFPVLPLCFVLLAMASRSSSSPCPPTSGGSRLRSRTKGASTSG